MSAKNEQSIQLAPLWQPLFETSARGEIWSQRSAADAAAAAENQVAEWRAAGYRGPGVVLVRRSGETDFELYRVDVVEQLVARRVVV